MADRVYLTVSAGPSARTADVILVTEDPTVVRAVMDAIRRRCTATRNGSAWSPEAEADAFADGLGLEGVR